MVSRQIAIPIIIISIFIGCGPTKLIDIQESSTELQLTDAQTQIIQPKIQHIRDIVDDYDFEKHQMDKDIRDYRLVADDRQLYRPDGGLSTAQRQRSLNQIRIKVRKFLAQRNTYLKEIEKLLREIHAELSSKQQELFAELKMPELEIPPSLRRDPHADLRRIPSHLIGVQ